MGDQIYEPLVAFILTVDRAGFGILLTSSLCFGTALVTFLWGRFALRGRILLFCCGFLVASALGILGVWLMSSRWLIRLETVRF